MPANYVLLEKVVVGAATAASVTFSNIPQSGYTDLVLRVSSSDSRGLAVSDLQFGFNGQSKGTSISGRYFYGNGSTSTSTAISGSGELGFGEGNVASTFGNTEIYIPNYTSSNYKSISSDSVTESTTTTAYALLLSGVWSSTSAINSITIYPYTANFLANSTFYLYGVAAAGVTPQIAPKATGGDTILTDGSYWYHAFKSSGTFTPNNAFVADVLCIAGGGGGGTGTAHYYYVSAGGGAGGVVYTAGRSFAGSTSYTVTVGAGGATNPTSRGSQGGNSNITGGTLSLTAAVGGGGGDNGGNGGGSGGSGGGTTQNLNPAVYSGATAGQGNIGGSHSSYSGGGGGGAGAPGSYNPTSNTVNTYTGGPGGAGTNAYSSWATATGTGVSGYYAGGGGGGNAMYYGTPATTLNGGAGGGGKGGGTYNVVIPGSGVANTGGGGGGSGGDGSGTSNAGGNGGSGLVIVRYPV